MGEYGKGSGPHKERDWDGLGAGSKQTGGEKERQCAVTQERGRVVFKWSPGPRGGRVSKKRRTFDLKNGRTKEKGKKDC